MLLGAGGPFAAAIVGNPVPVVDDLVCPTAGGGGGTKEDEDDFAGSSYDGGGKIGWAEALPVDDGPPPPARLRCVDPAAPLAALSACCTICC